MNLATRTSSIQATLHWWYSIYTRQVLKHGANLNGTLSKHYTHTSRAPGRKKWKQVHRNLLLRTGRCALCSQLKWFESFRRAQICQRLSSPTFRDSRQIPASTAVTVMLCQPAVSLSKIFPRVMAPVTGSMLKMCSWSVPRSMEYLQSRPVCVIVAYLMNPNPAWCF